MSDQELPSHIHRPKHTGMKRARSAEEYIDLVQQALFEVEDMRASIEFDSEGMGDALIFMEKLEAAVKGLHQSMVDGTYTFGRDDLGFMSIVKTAENNALPFKYMLTRINETHKHGLEVEEED